MSSSLKFPTSFSEFIFYLYLIVLVSSNSKIENPQMIKIPHNAKVSSSYDKSFDSVEYNLVDQNVPVPVLTPTSSIENNVYQQDRSL